MKRWIAQSLFAAAVATCGIGQSTWANAQPGAQSQEGGPGLCSELAGRTQAGRRREMPGNTTAPYFTDVPMTVVGVYGRTTLDMLSSGPFMLVKWPDGCCPESRRWRAGDTGQGPAGDARHVDFLWLAL